jgi:cellobiose phosphorylase
VLEDLIGYKEDKDGFYLLPSLCNSFDQFTLKIDRHGTLYTVKCRSGEKNSFKLDGKIVNNRFIFDKKSHFLEITVEKNS